MNLIPYRSRGFVSPFRAFGTFQDEIDRMLNRSIFGEGERLATEHSFSPAVDLYEDDDKIVVKADLPGMQEKEIEISVEDHVLTVKGEKEREHEDKGKGWRRIERAHGSFVRTLSLPETVDVDKISAKYKHGVLEITAPKSAQAKPKKIEVEVK